MKLNAPTRRQILRGAGVSVALPFLPSLARPARAATQKKYLALFNITQGGYRDEKVSPRRVRG